MWPLHPRSFFSDLTDKGETSHGPSLFMKAANTRRDMFYWWGTKNNGAWDFLWLWGRSRGKEREGETYAWEPMRGNISVPPESFSRYAAQAKVNTLLRDANGKNVELSRSFFHSEGAQPSHTSRLGRYYGREFEKWIGQQGHCLFRD